MRKPIYFIATLFTICNASSAATVDPDTLIKVSPTNSGKCVEYYINKGEMYCSTTPQSDQPVDPKIKDYEKLNITFDDRIWKAAWGKQTPTVTTVEYVPDGEDINDWHELVTSQFFPGLQEKTTLEQYVNYMIKTLNESGFKPITHIIEQSDDKVLFEFRITEPENQKQDELQLIMKGDEGIYVLHYVIKEADMGKENRDKWIQNLKSSQPK